MKVELICVSGAALASLLQSIATSRDADFDGLILGSHHARTVSTMHDDREESTQDVVEARVVGFLCCACTCSFYDAAGQPADEKLAELLAASDMMVLGWFIFRDKVALVPSMRDKAVCAALPAALAHLQPAYAEPMPLVFAIFRSFTDHNGASLSFEQRFFQQLPPASTGEPARLVATPMAVTNLGAAKGFRAYEPLAPVAGLPRVPRAAADRSAISTQPSGPAADAGATDTFVAVPEEDLRRVTGMDVQIQIKGVEAVYKTMLLEVGKLCAGLSSKEEDLDRLRSEIQAMP